MAFDGPRNVSSGWIKASPPTRYCTSDSAMTIKNGNQIIFLINTKNEDKAKTWLKDNGFEKERKN